VADAEVQMLKNVSHQLLRVRKRNKMDIERLSYNALRIEKYDFDMCLVICQHCGCCVAAGN
jgi:hypothetical protein